MEINTCLSLITLSVNGLNAPMERHRVAEWIRKQDPYIYAAYKRPTSECKIPRLKVKKNEKGRTKMEA